MPLDLLCVQLSFVNPLFQDFPSRTSKSLSPSFGNRYNYWGNFYSPLAANPGGKFQPPPRLANAMNGSCAFEHETFPCEGKIFPGQVVWERRPLFGAVSKTVYPGVLGLALFLVVLFSQGKFLPSTWGTSSRRPALEFSMARIISGSSVLRQRPGFGAEMTKPSAKEVLQKL